MARLFDPNRTRQNFDRFLLKAELSKLSGESMSRGAAIMRLGTVIEAWLVGLRREIAPVLRTCHAELKQSIEAGEALGDVHTPAARSGAFALSHWLLHNESDTVSYLAALDAFDSYFERGGRRVVDPPRFNDETQRFEPIVERGLPIADEEILHGYLADYLATCIESERYERGVALYEGVGGQVTLDPSHLRKATEFGYWLCRQKIQGVAADSRTYLPVGERVLKAHLQGPWLGHGQAKKAATWLKVLYWDSGMLGYPGDALLKAYDLMPDVPRPAFLP